MLPLLLGLAGLAKSAAIDVPAAARQRKLAAATQRFSPWTGMQAGPVKEADPLGSALSFGLTGLSLDQNMDMHNKLMQQKDLATLGALGKDLGAQAPMAYAGSSYGGTPWASLRTG